jgi:hypothetical protein
MIRLGDEVMLAQSGFPLGKVLCFHTTIGKATVALPQGGTVRVPLSLLSPAERVEPPIARKSAPRRRT